jgi:serine/threonine protein kinase
LPVELPGYRLEQQIGMGAGSRIYKAVERETGKVFAVKHVVRERASDDRYFAQVENEFKVSSAIDHPHLRHSYILHRVRKLLQVKELYLVMEYVDGLPVEIARPNRMNTFFMIFRKVTFGLEAMHKAGWVHSDIKPKNIMIGRGGIVKIIDFGQSCPLGQRKERVQGTPDYIAPEQVRRRALDQRTDIFNLGATMYWTLTSQKYPTVMTAELDPDGMNYIPVDEPVAPVEWNAKIPLPLSNLVMECCRDHPADRPDNMEEVRNRLEAIQERWGKHREDERARLTAKGANSATAGGKPEEEKQPPARKSDE